MRSLESRVTRVIHREYHQFRKSILKWRKDEIYESCGKIYFYACIEEYFRYNKYIPKRFFRDMVRFQLSIAHLWKVYLKNEEASVVTWKGIEALITLSCYEKGEGYDKCQTRAC